MAEFNLIDKPWIPCIDFRGSRVEHGIRDALVNAHKLRDICDDSPLVNVAVHRLLLAVLYRAFRGPCDTSQWKALYQSGHLASAYRLEEYLKKCHDRFFLFHETHPFMQAAGLDLNEYNKDGTVKKDKSDGLMRLTREAPDKSGRILFDHRMGTERPQYEPKQIIKMLLSAQSYSGTGVAGQGQVRGHKIEPTPCQFAPCVNGLCLWLQGHNLFETLLLNLVPHDLLQNDLPAWEDDGIQQTAMRSWSRPVTFAGRVQRFAPLSRLVRVIDMRSIFFTNGLKVSVDTNDPMMAYSRTDESHPYVALKLHEGKATWRDAHTLFSVQCAVRKPPASVNHFARLLREGIVQGSSHPIANVVGLATERGKCELWRHDRLSVPLALLASADVRERLGQLIAEAETVGNTLYRGLFWSAPQKRAVRSEPIGRIQTIVDLILAPTLELRGNGIVRMSSGKLPTDAHNASALELARHLDPRPLYWARLEEHFFELLEQLPADWDEATGRWKPEDQQGATPTWRRRVKQEAQRALEESIRSLGTTARTIQAVARVRTGFTDDDLKPPEQRTNKTQPKGAKTK